VTVGESTSNLWNRRISVSVYLRKAVYLSNESYDRYVGGVVKLVSNRWL
jgi:hypothetical protein